MKSKIIKVALTGRTNAGKSTLVNSFVGEKISIINKKINTTQDLIILSGAYKVFTPHLYSFKIF